MFDTSNYVSRFFGGYRFFDEKSRFLVNYSGAGGFDLDGVLHRDRALIAGSLRFIKDIEARRIVNRSEGRRVDHFNLRKGTNLNKSIAQWHRIRRAVDKIKSGAVRNESGERYTDVIMNGIGGSFLGPLMLLISGHGSDFNFNRSLALRIHFLSNTDPESFDLLMRKLDPSRVLMVNISKSGGTAETAGNMEAFNRILLRKHLFIGRHNMAVTTPGSSLEKYGRKQRFLHVFPMNEETGGRTSIGSAVGMVPAAFGGLDFEAFLRGESHMDSLTRRSRVRANPGLLLALVINDLIRREGHKNQIMLGYSDSMKEVAHYFQQLFMESLGKKRTLSGRLRKEPTGLTIFGGVGTGEQHAFMQQVQEGIRDCFVHFISFRKRRADFPNEKAGSMGRQLLAFVEGTQKALLGNGREFVSLVFEEANEFNMGMLVALEERIVAFLGGMWGINPFDQPGVQAGKVSADHHNAISKRVVSWLIEHRRFEGSALDMARNIGVNVGEGPGIEAVLSDLVSNHMIRNTYPGLETFYCAMNWKRNRFSYTIQNANS